MAEPTAANRSPLGATLAQAISTLRHSLDDPFAPITVVVPSTANGTLARRALATSGPFIRVWFQTPEELARAEAPDSLWDQGLRREPPAWLHATLGAVLPRLKTEGKLGRHGDTLLLPGWRAPLVAAIRHLESEGLSSKDLDSEGAPPHVGERVDLLRHVLEAIERAREEDRLFPPGALEHAARAVVDERQGVAASAARGAVVLGDHTLSAPVFRYLAAWLRARPCVRVDVPPFSNVAPAPRGLLRACPDTCEIIEVEPAAAPGSALAALQSGLFSSSPGTSPDDTVVFARPPDEVREHTECVREVQRAIRRGVPLDRIAIALPDVEQVVTLKESLDRAGIPASWLVSPPLRQLPAAQLLHLALDVAAGEQTLRAWYELLRHPALRLRGHPAAEPVEGKGRWRRLLARCGWATGTANIVAALRDQLEALEEETSDDLAGKERKGAALSSLIRAITAVDAALEAFQAPGTLGEHGERWAGFLKAFAWASDGRRELVTALQGFGPAGSGPRLSLHEARLELDELTQTRVQRGHLTDRAVKVLSPMHLLGGAFDLVCVLGLTERRFPSPAPEEPLLSDDVLRHLSRTRAGDDALRLASEHEDVERRRFTAAVSAASKRLWLSTPAAEFEAERPSVPSPFLLDALAAVVGERARYADLEARLVKAGSRSRVVPEAPVDALGQAEHLASRVTASPGALLPALASHTTSRRLLQLHLSQHRVARGADLDAWTGLVDPALLPCPGLDGAPLSLEDLVALLASPGRFFFRQILGAWPAPRLGREGSPLGGRPFRRAVIESLEKTLGLVYPGSEGEQLAGFGEAFQKELDAALSAATRHASVLDEELHTAAASGAVLASTLIETRNQLLGALRGELDAVRIDESLPWRVTGSAGRLVLEDGAGKLVALTDAEGPPAKKDLKGGDARDVVLAGLAHARQGEEVSEVEVLALNGARVFERLDKVADEVLAALREVTGQVQGGRFQVGRDRVFGLADDDVQPAGDDEDEALGVAA